MDGDTKDMSIQARETDCGVWGGLTSPELYTQHQNLFVTQWKCNAVRFMSTATDQIKTDSVTHSQDDINDKPTYLS